LAVLGATASAALAEEPAQGRGLARSALCEPRPSEDRVEASIERGGIKLASGRIVKLAGVRMAEEPPAAGAGAEWLRSLQGSPVEVGALAAESDRWGRLPATLRIASDAGPIDLGRGLVAAGLAIVDAGEADRLCQPELLAAEARARELRLGLWRLDRYRPVAAADLESLRQRIGQFALIEGRVRSVGERSRRTYLNFGSDWNADFTITIPQRTWQTMRERGLSAAGLRGRLVRTRGMIEEWGGPAMTIMAPEMLEILDEVIPRRR
jgi:Staphylococcal nuclease homologue